MKKVIYQSLTILCFSVFIFSKTNAQGVGINATGAAPDASAMLHVDAGTSTSKGLLVTGTYNAAGTVPDLGTGSRLMFYPAKAAFRVGYTTFEKWNNTNVGNYSVAMGNGTEARGSNSTALGFNSGAIGDFSTAIGTSSNAFGSQSVAIGSGNNASGLASNAFGRNSQANGDYSVTIGSNCTASGLYSIATGRISVASGISSMAFGHNTTASGNNSTAMGSSVSTNGRNGAFIIGDALGTGSISNVDNSMTMGFVGGYRLFTTASMGAYLPPGSNAWVALSDINRKENLEPLDGEDVLQKISKIKFTSWNYKKQDPKVNRHYGIMAQDFYNSFGKDKHGSIGNDSTVNPIDMIGIDMAAIQALEKRTAELKTELAAAKEQNEKLNRKLAAIDEVKKENEVLKQSVAQMQAELLEQQKLIAQTLNEIKLLAVKQAASASLTKK